MRDFEYFRATTVEEALTLLSSYKDGAKLIAGGQSLLVLMRQGLISPEYVIDIKGIKALDYIDYDDSMGLRVGALTTHRAIERSELIKRHFRVLSEMERNLATIQTRNWGTVGGNLCYGHHSGDLAPVLISLGAKLKIGRLGGERVVDVEVFTKDLLEVDLGSDEMLLEIQIPPLGRNAGVAYDKLMVMQGDIGIVGAAVFLRLNPSDGVCEDARIGLSGASIVPLRARGAEKALIGRRVDDVVLSEAAEVASGEADPPSDVHASAEYRREMIKVFVRRVGKVALERATKG